MTTSWLVPAQWARRPAPSRSEWRQLVDGVLTDPARLQLHFQPIVSLQDAVIVGYEALSRFDGPPGLTPDLWFAAADEQGRGAELEALAVERCLAMRSSLPDNCFLTVNVSPHLLTSSPVTELLRGVGDLRALVIELTEHRAVDDLESLVALRDELAARGALLALDDAGSGYSGLQQMMQFRPHFIKLDRALVAGADRDEVKLALAELVGEFGGRIDAWLLAEGIETWGELGAFQRLRVPLAQGYLLGRPAPAWPRLDPATASRLRTGAAQARLVEQVASLVEGVPLVQRGLPAAGRVGVRVDALGQPLALLLPRHPDTGEPSGHRPAPVSLRVSQTTSVVELARRVVSRPDAHRFDPVVCVDGRGRATGVVHVERVLLRLAELKSERGSAEIKARRASAVPGVEEQT